MAKTVNAISNASIAGFCSTAMKYPRWRISAKTSAWRKMAPPKQLKPKLWNMMRILRLNTGESVIDDRKIINCFGGLIAYEAVNRIDTKDCC